MTWFVKFCRSMYSKLHEIKLAVWERKPARNDSTWPTYGDHSARENITGWTWSFAGLYM